MSCYILPEVGFFSNTDGQKYVINYFIPSYYPMLYI